MLKTKPEKVRSSFDLIGALSCGLIFSYLFYRAADGQVRNLSSSTTLLLYFSVGSFCYLLFYFLVWRFIALRFLYGYLNFVFVSLCGFTSFVFFILLAKVWFDDFPINHFFLYQPFFRILLHLNLLALAPMAFFSVIGVIASMFSNKGKLLP